MAASVSEEGAAKLVRAVSVKSTVPFTTRLLTVVVPLDAVKFPVTSPVMFPVIFPVTFPVTFPVMLPAKLEDAVITVPVIAAADDPPITIPLIVPPVNVALDETKDELAVTVPDAVIAPVVSDVGFIPNSNILLLPSLPNNRLSAVF